MPEELTIEKLREEVNPVYNIINMKDSIREIIETTGFDTIFC